ncbi:tRNA (adenosine(37)-N6)-threonylcarbamoyltransferase complex ATPase subunit type 1 TsaE [Hippea alviniae]|uniref:tRNA (adenosine(37)-N6)-threonylcarbamoyltransferase complex ATPase subunit type 1 TsaE n=1 Tax=Hippea alviniae TaxID=1279027 RepID=UPI0003B527C9|nr:tRNA (adenosine(37)-N6)-threonylcarbamoyltransferase complex ATPase subunit type 1 TsaE [Hippea alviniae]
MKALKTFLSKSEEDTKKAAYWVVENLAKKGNKCIVFLKGDLGSGKTRFVKFALESLGIKEEEFNGSPTFTVINEYRDGIYHIDLYRVGIDESVVEYLENEEGIFFIEWPEELNIEPDIVIEFEIEGEQRRRIDVYSS